MRSLHWRQRYQALETGLLRTPRQAVIFLGDSLTEQFDLDYFFPDRKLANHGISGDHIDGLLERLHLCRKARPRQLWLMIGINDLFDGRDDAYMQTAYDQLLQALNFCPQVTVQSLLPTGPEWDDRAEKRITTMNRFLQKNARQYGYDYLDLHTPFTRAMADGEKLFQEDDIHLNDHAYTLWSKTIRPLL